ncbi:hypothetical protein Mudajogi_00011 [Pseudomonas phage vB_PpuP-Mudajogi]|uniref:Uncharacterized protein n=1 Tax=Pseudomonas phage vB_PpuP-Mudajogi TaxID=3132683 RepID=A0AAX4NBQ5_9CAUD
MSQIISEIYRENRDMTTTFTMRLQGHNGRLTVTGLEDHFGAYGRYERQPQNALKAFNDAFKETFEYLVGTSNERIILTLDIALQTANFLKETN